MAALVQLSFQCKSKLLVGGCFSLAEAKIWSDWFWFSPNSNDRIFKTISILLKDYYFAQSLWLSLQDLIWKIYLTDRRWEDRCKFLFLNLVLLSIWFQCYSQIDRFACYRFASCLTRGRLILAVRAAAFHPLCLWANTLRLISPSPPGCHTSFSSPATVSLSSSDTPLT